MAKLGKFKDVYPNLRDTEAGLFPANPRFPHWTLCFILTASVLASAALGFFVYNFYWLERPVFAERCPERIIALKTNPRGGPKDDFWAYATFWSYNPQEKGQTIAKFAPKRLLNRLEKTFKPLSLRSLEHLPESCKDKFPNVIVEQIPDPMSDVSINGVKNMAFPEDLDPLSSPLFSSDLSSEFRFHDHISDLAQSIMSRAEQVMIGRKKPFDVRIPIYLSSITPEMEEILAPNNSGIDLVAEQRRAINAAMDDYRQSSKPLFIVMGDQSLVPGMANDDVVRVSKLPIPVSLAVISSGDGAIFNHGLWPTFGALLARSNVTSHAMNKTILDAANNASLNWKAAVTY